MYSFDCLCYFVHDDMVNLTPQKKREDGITGNIKLFYSIRFAYLKLKNLNLAYDLFK